MLTPASLFALSPLLLLISIIAAVLTIKAKSKAFWLLISALAGGVIFSAALVLEFSSSMDWEKYAVITQFLALPIGLTFLIQFAYASFDVHSQMMQLERRIVAWLCVGTLIFTLSISVVYDRTSSPQTASIAAVQIMTFGIAFVYILVIVVFVRQLMHCATQYGTGFWASMIHSANSVMRMFRTFILALCIPLMLTGFTIIRDTRATERTFFSSGSVPAPCSFSL